MHRGEAQVQPELTNVLRTLSEAPYIAYVYSRRHINTCIRTPDEKVTPPAGCHTAMEMVIHPR